MNGHETPRRITPWRETWRQLIRAAAPHQVALRRSLLELLAAATLQGMALACLLLRACRSCRTHSAIKPPAEQLP